VQREIEEWRLCAQFVCLTNVLRRERAGVLCC